MCAIILFIHSDYLHFDSFFFIFFLLFFLGILIKITQCHFLDPTFLKNRTTDFDETLHVAWVCLCEGFGNSGRSAYSPVQKKGGRPEAAIALRVIQIDFSNQVLFTHYITN